MSYKQVEFIIKITKPKSYTIKELKEYIIDAVQTYRGSFHPEDELFDFDLNITVRRIEVEK